MKLQFLGTSAGSPTRTRNVTALALGFDQGQGWYLFDCGEATQHQLQKSPFSLGRLSKIFITHLHGDHIFGLPGLLTSRSMAGSAKTPIRLYGPKGIKEFLETSLRLSASHITYPLEITEFSKAGELYSDTRETIETVRLSHDVPSFAYVVREAERPGPFDIDKARAAGVPSGPLLGRLHKGETVELDDGRKLAGSDFSGPPRPGRTIIIGGDNDDPSLLAEHLRSADLFIHEATLTEPVKAGLSFLARHSTAADVAKAASTAGLSNLILTHISARFRFEPKETGRSVVELEKEARTHFDGTLYLAKDLDMFALSRDGELTVIEPQS